MQENLNTKELMLLDSERNFAIMCNKKHVANTCGATDSMHEEKNGGVITSKTMSYS